METTDDVKAFVPVTPEEELDELRERRMQLMEESTALHNALETERRSLWERAEVLRRDLAEVEGRLNDLRYDPRSVQIETNEREVGMIGAQIETLEPSVAAEEDLDTDVIEQLLSKLRAGELRSYTEGRSPEMDAALRVYLNEANQLALWGMHARRAKKISGTTVKLPDCARHYSKQRIEEISKRPPSNFGTTSASSSRSESSVAVEVPTLPSGFARTGYSPPPADPPAGFERVSQPIHR